jgi:hypothetical protein
MEREVAMDPNLAGEVGDKDRVKKKPMAMASI